MELHKFILQKNLTGATFLLASAANMLGTSRFPKGCMKWQHAIILQNQLDHNFLFRLMDWTSYSSSDLLSSFLRPFTWTNYSKSKLPFSLLSLLGQKLLKVQFFFPLLFGQNYCKSKMRLLFALLGLKVLSPTASFQKDSNSNFLSD